MRIRFFLFMIGLVGILGRLEAQQTSTSPYSSLGLGESKATTDIIHSSMGGIGVSYISDFNNEANFANPAANKNLSYTTFNIGVNTDYTSAETNTQKSDRSATYLSSLSLAFPVGEKSRFGMNLQPVTSVGYDITYKGDNPLQYTELKGRGGINSVSSFYSYNITNSLSLGVKVGYDWGEVKKQQETSVEGADLVTEIADNKSYSYFDYTVGLAYVHRVKEDYLFKIGATYNIGHNAETDASYLASTYYYSSGSRQNIDTINYSRGNLDTKIPSSYSIGLAYGKEDKWSVAADFKYTEQSKIKTTEINPLNFEYEDKYRVSLGGWVLPNANGYKSYFERVIYRYGLYYENTGVKYRETNIDQYGITLGASFPLGASSRQDPSLLNLGVELGQRGTKSEGLIKENFINVKVGINFSDLWFKKRKYD